ncbi:hypothetical protein D3C84_557480 [compost metagenome]
MIRMYGLILQDFNLKILRNEFLVGTSADLVVATGADFFIVGWHHQNAVFVRVQALTNGFNHLLVVASTTCDFVRNI